MRNMDFVQVGEQVGRRIHRGQRLKYVKNRVYFDDHIKPIAERGRTDEEKVLGFTHDTPEQIISNINEDRKERGLKPLNQYEEEVRIEDALRNIVNEFKYYGHDLTLQSPFIEDLDILTKRTSDKGFDGYMQYGQRIIEYAKRTGRTEVIVVKLADLENNMHPARNLSRSVQSQKDKDRLARYRALHALLRKEFPNVEPRLSRNDRPNRKKYHMARTSRGRSRMALKQGRDKRISLE